jgi:hypothetical protein
VVMKGNLTPTLLTLPEKTEFGPTFGAEDCSRSHQREVSYRVKRVYVDVSIE